MLVLIYLVLLVIGLLTIEHLYKRCSTNLLYKLPSPPMLPLFGNGLMVNGSLEELWKTIRKCLNEYYPIVCLWVFTKPVVLIRHPDDMQILLKSKNNIIKADAAYHYVRKLGNDGLITSGGKKWFERRKLMNQAFLRNTLKRTAESANKHTDLFVQQMLHWDDESIQNILPLTMTFSLSIICDTALGYDLHTTGAQYQEEFRKTFEDAINTILHRCMWPFLTDWMFRLLPVGRDQLRLRKTIKTFTDRIIEERRNHLEANGINLLSDDFSRNFQTEADLEDTEVKPSKELNLVDMLLIYNAKGLIDNQGVFEEIETLISAGYDTTGLAVAFTLLLLAENEVEQNLARKEVTDVMKKCGSKLTISELNNLQYLDRCVKEVLRLFPSAPMIGRKLVEDTKFSKYVVPRNTDVFMCFYDLHRDPNFWPEPTKFNPDRFLPEFSKDRHPYAYLPFSGGLRNCIGQKHVPVEVKAFTAHVLYNFYLKPVDLTHNVTFDVHATLKPTTDVLRVKFIKILRHH